ncbi:MAG: S-layer homology domain-containing protein [Clostridia bacterium]|nr:S-layer homology domain-containing protein [Clostridia bacterium]
MKKIYVFAICAALALVAVMSVFAASFTDIEVGEYYSDAAQRMAARGILDGYGDGMYHGDESVTRAQLAALICKMLGKTDEAVSLAGKTNFTDVNEDAWYTGYINYAVANGIIIGDGNGKFRPDDYVKYEEVVKVVVCVLGLDEDIEIDPADWSKEYIEAAKSVKLLDNLIGEKGTVMLRSDIAVICDAAMTLLDRAVGENLVSASEVETTTAKKNTSNAAATGSAKTTSAPAPDETTTATTRENQLPMITF